MAGINYLYPRAQYRSTELHAVLRGAFANELSYLQSIPCILYADSVPEVSIGKYMYFVLLKQVNWLDRHLPWVLSTSPSGLLTPKLS